jgi:hypothetical protein
MNLDAGTDHLPAQRIGFGVEWMHDVFVISTKGNEGTEGHSGGTDRRKARICFGPLKLTMLRGRFSQRVAGAGTGLSAEIVSGLPGVIGGHRETGRTADSVRLLSSGQRRLRV